MFKFFRRRSDDKALAGNAEQELSTLRKIRMANEALKKLDKLNIERRFHMIPIELERRGI